MPQFLLFTTKTLIFKTAAHRSLRSPKYAGSVDPHSLGAPGWQWQMSLTAPLTSLFMFAKDKVLYSGGWLTLSECKVQKVHIEHSHCFHVADFLCNIHFVSVSICAIFQVLYLPHACRIYNASTYVTSMSRYLLWLSVCFALASRAPFYYTSSLLHFMSAYFFFFQMSFFLCLDLSCNLTGHEGKHLPLCERHNCNKVSKRCFCQWRCFCMLLNKLNYGSRL